MTLAQVFRHPLLAAAEHLAALLERVGHRRLSLDPRKSAGNTGERLAYFHLRRNGYVVVARQWRAPNINGEIDLIAWQGETLCFVEVKTRTRDDRFAPAYAVDRKKREDLRRMASAYIQGLPWQGDEPPRPTIRFDGVFLLLDQQPPKIDLQTGIF